ncbi:O-antigen polymerase [Paenibacillus wynnii]|uniref:O-antigen polymerase n=1 Tax=Paenibacillus wynnii TaxID=268407 RepID=UPI00278D281F|nr:O-antigen polymerase [Paenibacillus wynnii]MDQ0196272.1 oligosaccharide repeat unit polymerase [Paenibacillus wynnii]
MILIIFALVLCAMLYGYFKEHNIYNPLFLFCGFIGFISLLASFQFYGMNKTSDKAYFVIILGILGYICGIGFYKIVFGRLKTSISDVVIEHNRINTKLLFVAVLSMTIFSAYRFANILPLLLQGYALDYIRLVYFGVEFDGIGISHITAVIEMFLNLPLLYAIIAIIVIDLISGKEREIGNFTLTLVIIWISLATIVSGGRATIYIVAVELFFAALILKRNLKLSKGTKTSIILIIICAIVFMFLMTSNRATNGEYDILYSLYTYFSGSMPHMSYRLDTIDFSNQYTYGMTFFSGLLRPLMLIYKWISGSFPDVYQMTLDIGVQLQTAVDIGTGKSFNAFVPSFFYFYFEYGYIGVVFDSIIYGVVCQYFYIKMKLKMSKRNIALYLLIIQGMLTSMIRYPFILVYYTFAFFIIIMFYKKQDKI